MVRVGIIGMGFMGSMHFRNYQKIPQAKVVAVGDINSRRAHGDLSDLWGNIGSPSAASLPMEGITPLTDARQLMARPEVDLVDICVPTPAHVALAIEALAAGKHVLCEKPLARTAADARRLAQAAGKAKGFFMPAMCMRFWPQWAWLKQSIVENRYGKVRAATFRRLGSPPGVAWYKDGANSGGAVLDLHIHDTDFVNFLFGAPAAVFTCGYSAFTGSLDHVLTQYLYPGGPAVSAEGGWDMAAGFGFSMRYTVNFERATADFDSSRDRPLLLYADGKSEPISCAATDGYFEEINYFIACIQTGRRPETVTADDAAAAIGIIEAEVKSAQTGRPVKISS